MLCVGRIHHACSRDGMVGHALGAPLVSIFRVSRDNLLRRQVSVRAQCRLVAAFRAARLQFCRKRCE